ncbi:hydrogenase maturation nickel metallochaperone HypA [Frankia sp. AgB1.9]|uniref:hydrogenase maturation nickel metallochaperone HypA n=1 Tax=unclassified Frankia TaxID=2632575 RepID=UPI001931EA0E|nr:MULTISPECIES: hydrogenase maturation nickel metallochaperone HypA [unclassified Frankia]MBL7493045.1 hydrogenase maturation nickel metallochaperone HypA [Frankia sp. AgW1.1]MBL7548279.1 hydrogenase maturation nickel metallochaperone HypA [Frankia sp. AgB1.9]MBL7618874.1 hydrogenase maturation nickel metallochaperone HypA [Frankia sp. AgB1.8]
MHEMGVTTEIVERVTDRLASAAPPGAKVAAVRLEIGRLSGYTAESVRGCFEFAAAGTPLEGARLDVTEPAGHGTCRSCGHTVDVADPLATCPSCGGTDLMVQDGQQLRVLGVELAPDAPAANQAGSG